jgi:hypothetical protein
LDRDLHGSWEKAPKIAPNASVNETQEKVQQTEKYEQQLLQVRMA